MRLTLPLKKAPFLVFAAMLLAVSPVLAQSSGGATQGYIGSDPNAAPPSPPPGSITTAAPPVRAEPPTLPPVFDTVRTSEPEKPEEPAVADPCADFADSYDAYNICQDRMKKIERMRDAKNRRMGISPAPAPTAPEAEKPLTPEEAAKQAAEKVEELEKKLQEKEAAEAAAKAAPTTKKGIGEFDRNPDKGKPLFK